MSTRDDTETAWVADPSIAWRILLTAALAGDVTVPTVAARQSRLHEAQGWPAPRPVITGELAWLRRDLAEVRDEPLVVGLAGRDLVVSAFHAYLDGLGLLDVLSALTGATATSATRGIGDRPPPQSVLRAGVSRLGEVAFAPPATVVRPVVTPTDGDAFAATTVLGVVRTAALVRATAAGVVAHNRAVGAKARHVAVAVGAGRRSEDGRLANRSELIRLREVESLSLVAVEDALRSAPLSGAGGTGAAGGAAVRLALRVLGPRLGSTVLVSHLGEVTTEAAHDLSFYPVTAGGSGLSLGAAGHGGSTVLTLRARGTAWDGDSLRRLLDRIAERLTSTR